MKLVDSGEPTSFLDHVYLGCTRREWKPNEILFLRSTTAGATFKLKVWEKETSRNVRLKLLRYGRSCEKVLRKANEKSEHLYKVSNFLLG